MDYETCQNNFLVFFFTDLFGTKGSFIAFSWQQRKTLLSYLAVTKLVKKILFCPQLPVGRIFFYCFSLFF